LTEDEIHKIAAIEQRHWWYRGTRDICFSLLEPFLPDRGARLRADDSRGVRLRADRGSNPPLQVLDVGCGTGGNLIALSRLGHARGIDIDPLCVEYCRQRGLDAVLGSMADLREPPASVDLLTMFDVLYHAEPDDTVPILRGMANVITPGGLIAFREPAMNIARGWHDRAVNGRQRFTTGGIAASLREAGFEPLRTTYLNTVLFPPIVLVRRLQDLREPDLAKSDVEDTPEPLNSLLLGVLRFEQAMLQAIDLPFGVSLFAVAQKAR
jgi:SAM-dependent methyltransferase